MLRMVLEAVPHDYNDYMREKVSKVNLDLRAKIRKIFDAIET